MNFTIEELNKMMERNGGSLDLRNTSITELPDNLTVGGYLDLRNTSITELPDNLTVGGYLYLRNTSITELPDNLTVGGYLDLEGTSITEKESRRVRRLQDGDYVEGKYLYADGILIHVKRCKKILDQYTYYIGKIKNKNVVFDGENYAHCKDLKSGIRDLEFKKAKERGSIQYKDLKSDSILKVDEAIAMYRIITGACEQGSKQFVESIENIKDEYTVSEILKLTKSQYGGNSFEEFFLNK